MVIGKGQDRLSYEDYPDWLRDNHDIDLWGGVEEGWHEFLTPRLKEQFEQSTFWTTLGQRLPQWNEEFLSEHNSFALLQTTNLPDVDTKSYSSSVQKSYRHNVARNPRWPFPPLEASDEVKSRSLRPEEEGDWIEPRNWIAHFPDIIRTRLVALYFDGVVVLTSKILGLARDLGVDATEEFEASQDGYYAAHVLVGMNFDTIDPQTRERVPVQARVEIQVTTAIQNTINQMLHEVYEKSRLQFERDNRWQWDHRSAEFAINNLGHTLHYLEGMMVVARERVE